MNEHDFGDLARRDTERHLLAAVDESDNSKRAVMFLADFFSDSQNVFVTLLSIIPEPSEDFFPTEAERRQWLTEKEAAMRNTLRKSSLALAFRMDGSQPASPSGPAPSPSATPSWKSRKSCAAASWWWDAGGSPIARSSSSVPPPARFCTMPNTAP